MYQVKVNSQCERGYYYQTDGIGGQLGLDYCQTLDDEHFIVSCSSDQTYLEVTYYTDSECTSSSGTEVFTNYRTSYTSSIDGNTYWDPEFVCTGDTSGCSDSTDGFIGVATYTTTDTSITSCDDSGVTTDDFNVHAGSRVYIEESCFADIDNQGESDESVSYHAMVCQSGGWTIIDSPSSDCVGANTYDQVFTASGCVEDEDGNPTHIDILNCDVTDDNDDIIDDECQRGWFYQHDGLGLKMVLDFCFVIDGSVFKVSCNSDEDGLEITYYSDRTCTTIDYSGTQGTNGVFTDYRTTVTASDGTEYYNPEFECTGVTTGCSPQNSEGIVGWTVYTTDTSDGSTNPTSCSDVSVDELNYVIARWGYIHDECANDYETDSDGSESIISSFLQCSSSSSSSSSTSSEGLFLHMWQNEDNCGSDTGNSETSTNEISQVDSCGVDEDIGVYRSELIGCETDIDNGSGNDCVSGWQVMYQSENQRVLLVQCSDDAQGDFDDVELSVDIVQITEYDSSNTAIQASTTFTLTSNDDIFNTNEADAAIQTIYSYSSAMNGIELNYDVDIVAIDDSSSGSCQFSVAFLQATEDTTVTSTVNGDQTQWTVDSGDLKIEFIINEWPFVSSSNYLQVMLYANELSNTVCEKV